jgi:hypothetical protein
MSLLQELDFTDKMSQSVLFHINILIEYNFWNVAENNWNIAYR